MKTRASFLLASALGCALAASAWAQQNRADPRWQAWLGCWTPVSGAAPSATAKAPVVCVVPAGGEGVDILTVVDSAIVARDHIEVAGGRHAVAREGCTGWETAQWSSEGRRVYRQSEYTCPGGLKRATSELIAMTPDWEWLNVQGLVTHGGTGVRVLRYRTAAIPAEPPAEIAAALQNGSSGAGMARAAAAAPVAAADVVEASHQVDAAVVEAWLAEVGDGFSLDGRRLVALADSGVPARVIDVMVAMSYPRVFTVTAPSAQGEFGPVDASRRAPGVDTSYAYRHSVYGMGYYPAYGWDYYSPYSWSPYGYYSPFGYSPFGWGYSPYGYGGYYGGGTIFIVPGGGTTGGGATQNHGRVVKGRGFQQGGGRDGQGAGQGNSGTTAQPRERVSGASSASGSSKGSSAPAPSTPASSGSSSSSGQKAHPRP